MTWSVRGSIQTTSFCSPSPSRSPSATLAPSVDRYDRMCRTLGWTLRTYLYGGWLATSGNGVRLNRNVLTTSSDSTLDSAGSRVITYRLMTMAADTSQVARRRTDPGGRFILQVPLSMPIGRDAGAWPSLPQGSRGTQISSPGAGYRKLPCVTSAAERPSF